MCRLHWFGLTISFCTLLQAIPKINLGFCLGATEPVNVDSKAYVGQETIDVLLDLRITRKRRSTDDLSKYTPKYDVMHMRIAESSSLDLEVESMPLTLVLRKNVGHISPRLAQAGVYPLASRDYQGVLLFPNGTVAGDAAVSTGHGIPFGMAGIVKIQDQPFILEPLAVTSDIDNSTNSLCFPHKLIPRHAVAHRGRCKVEALPSNVQEEMDTTPSPDTAQRAVKLQAAPKSGASQKNKSPKPSTTRRVLQLAIFSDVYLYQYFQQQFKGKPLQNLTNYILTNVNAMNYLYKDTSLESDVKIDIQLAYMEILTQEPKSLGGHNSLEGVYLPKFCNFAAKKNSRGRLWDHAMMLTGTDLKDETSTGIIGVAYTGTMCNVKYSCSLIEAKNFLGAFTMAHEMGHSLGMNHDGEENNMACDGKRYIMAALEGPGQITWSSCSNSNLREFLRGQSSYNYRGRRPLCLTKPSAKAKRKRPAFPLSKAKKPGEIYSAGQQCRIALGSPLAEPAKPLFQMCQELYCSNGTFALRTHPALEGTTCGQGMWCKSGICVPKA